MRDFLAGYGGGASGPPDEPAYPTTAGEAGFRSLRQATALLEARGFRVLVHSRVPCNGGGISLGQAVAAAARDQADGSIAAPG